MLSCNALRLTLGRLNSFNLPVAAVCVRRFGSIRMKERNYKTAINALNTLQSNASVLKMIRSKRNLNLDSIPEVTELLRRVGYDVSDLNQLNIIHVAGTKGKGSTCAFTESILRSCGVRTGLYTSPHLMEVRERIRIDGLPISQEMFSTYFWDIWDRLQNKKTDTLGMPTYFRFITLMAFHTFMQEKIGAMILEVGIGGEYDPTNVVSKPVVCGLTSIGLDHVRVLGSTVSEIARHKAGIMKPGVPTITMNDQYPEALEVFKDVARERQVPLMEATPLAAMTTESGKPITIGLVGDHQLKNAAVAVAMCKIWLDRNKPNHAFSFDEHKLGSVFHPGVITKPMETGLSECRWPGRGHVVSLPSYVTTFYLDGAHTRESLEACSKWMDSLRSTKARSVLIFNCTIDREPSTLITPLLRLHSHLPFDDVIFCPNVVTTDASAPTDNINHNADLHKMLLWPLKTQSDWLKLCNIEQSNGEKGQCKTHVFKSIKGAVDWIFKTQKENGNTRPCQVFVTGSLHLVGNVLIALDQKVL